LARTAPVVDAAKLADLKAKAHEVRRLIIEAINYAKAGHLGGPLSVTDILVSLYFDVARVDPAKPRDPNRDRIILSKGHSAIGLYCTLALRGYLPIEETLTFDQINSRLQGHPDMTKLPGLDASTGSLGQGLSVGLGYALGAKLKKQDFHTFVILGDGEIQEGQIWEAAFVADRYKLDNLTAILDFNKIQQFGWISTGPGETRAMHASGTNPGEKFAAFGWNVLECDGHDIEQLLDTLRQAKAHKGQPTAVIANTIKGKGISFMEHDYNWHAKVMSEADYERAMSELLSAGKGA
jgi:transketolase